MADLSAFPPNMMRFSPKPLTIKIHTSMWEWPEVQALADQGHIVCSDPAVDECDIVLTPNAWLMDEQHRKYLPLALAEARRRRYPPTKKESA